MQTSCRLGHCLSREVSQKISDKVCELQSDCHFTSALDIPHNNLSYDQPTRIRNVAKKSGDVEFWEMQSSQAKLTGYRLTKNGSRKTEAEVLSLQCLLIPIILPILILIFTFLYNTGGRSLSIASHRLPCILTSDWGFSQLNCWPEEWADDEKNSFHVWL